MARRDTVRYQFKRGGRIVHRGITNDPDRREAEHRRDYRGGHLATVGPAVTRDSGLAWERAGGKKNRRRRSFWEKLFG